MSSDLPVSGQLAGLFAEGAGRRVLPDALPPGRIVRALDDRSGRPALWMSDGPASAGLWAQAALAERRGIQALGIRRAGLQVEHPR